MPHPASEPLVARAMRADARRNLERILAAAGEVFAEQGLEASVADVAARAGVGTATIFRRFPAKDDLVLAVVEARARELAEAARQAAAGDDPGRAFRAFMETAVAQLIRDRGFCEAAGLQLYGAPGLHELHVQLNASVRLLVRRAQDAGALRRDLVVEDVSVLVRAIAEASTLLQQARPGSWQRYLDLVLDGLRPAAATRLRRAAPTLGELERVCAARPGGTRLQSAPR